MVLVNALIGGNMGIFTVLMLAFCLYFVLTYFEHLKKGDEQLTKMAKWLAVGSLILALLIPAIYQLYVYNQMTNINILNNGF